MSSERTRDSCTPLAGSLCVGVFFGVSVMMDYIYQQER